MKTNGTWYYNVCRCLGVITHDLVAAAFAWVLAIWVLYGFSLSSAQLALIKYLPLVLGVQGLILWSTGIYRGIWRFASIPDLWNIVRAVVLSGVVVGFALLLAGQLDYVPGTLLILYPSFLILLLGAPRLIFRVWEERRPGFSERVYRKRALLLGAGRAGERLARNMLQDKEHVPIGFLDDTALKGTKIHGLPILGPVGDLPEVVRYEDVDLLAIAMPQATNAEMQRLVLLCEQTSIPFKTLPRTGTFPAEDSSFKALKEVALEDLLARETVSLNWQAISAKLVGKRVLITGGGGSIGAELCRQIAQLGISSLIIYERSEFHLHRIEWDLRQHFPNLKLYPHLGDVCNPAAVENVFAFYRPEIIFHAAAYKHVPMLENQVCEAVRNNVLGTKILAENAQRFGCTTFVLLSTDKAVNPINIMGMTKRIAEIFCQSWGNGSSTHFITVRFGNVLGSSGSVVPIFQRQIAAGGPVTVTHPKVTRYFMTVPEACQLIIQSVVMEQEGEIFVLDMGDQVSINELAEQMIRLSGKIPGRDIKIVYTGLRTGEKLCEELFYPEEDVVATSHQKILLARCCEYDVGLLNAWLEELQWACDRFDDKKARELLDQFNPEFFKIEFLPNKKTLFLNYNT